MWDTHRSLVMLSGGQDGLDEAGSWRQLKAAHDLLSCAPDDEVLAEMLTCQQELVVQMLCNQTALAPLLTAAVEDLPRQVAARQQRTKMAEDMRAIVLVCGHKYMLCCLPFFVLVVCKHAALARPVHTWCSFCHLCTCRKSCEFCVPVSMSVIAARQGITARGQASQARRGASSCQAEPGSFPG